MQTPDYDFWIANKHYLESMVGLLVGFPVEFYWCSSAMTGVGTRDCYQVMPSVEAEGPRRVFWEWHLDRNEQWFLNPLKAGAAFVKAWREWVTEVGDPS
jgi:hypothetical protein